MNQQLFPATDEKVPPPHPFSVRNSAVKRYSAVPGEDYETEWYHENSIKVASYNFIQQFWKRSGVVGQATQTGM